MFKPFDELLEKTQGYPQQRKDDMRGMAETLTTIGILSQDDLQKEVQEIIDNLPEIRRQRAEELREHANGMKLERPKKEKDDEVLAVDRNPADIEKDLAAKEQDRAERKRNLDLLKSEKLRDADTLDRSADKLASPTVDEQFKNRAVLTELAIRLRSRVAGVEKMVSELDPNRLEKFQYAMDKAENALPKDLPAADRHQTALLVFATEVRATGFNHVDLAVDNFHKNITGATAREDGHWGAISTDATSAGHDAGSDGEQKEAPTPAALQTQDYIADRIAKEDAAEHMERVKNNKVLINMPILAAEHLDQKQYATYRLIIENEHLLNWKIEDGKLIMKAKELDAGDQENTISKIVHRDLDYEKVRGANYSIQATIKKMDVLLRERGMEDITPSPNAKQRMEKPTDEITREVRDSQDKVKKDRGKGVGI